MEYKYKKCALLSNNVAEYPVPNSYKDEMVLH